MTGGIPIRPDMNPEAALQPRMIMGTFAPRRRIVSTHDVKKVDHRIINIATFAAVESLCSHYDHEVTNARKLPA